MIRPKYHVFVCTSCRMNGQQKGFCASNGANDLVLKLIEEIEDRELSGEVMVTNCGCFGICDKGPVMVVYPEGVWYGGLDEDRVAEIVESHLENGEAVKEYAI